MSHPHFSRSGTVPEGLELDKRTPIRIPLGALISLLVSTALAGAWLVRLETKTSANEKDLIEMKSAALIVGGTLEDTHERVIRLETKMDDLIRMSRTGTIAPMPALPLHN